MVRSLLLCPTCLCRLKALPCLLLWSLALCLVMLDSPCLWLCLSVALCSEPLLSRACGAAEPNGMGPWCDDTIDDCSKRNRWGSHNLTTSRYLAWYKAVSDAVTGVDSQLSVGGPASSVRPTDTRNSPWPAVTYIAVHVSILR